MFEAERNDSALSSPSGQTPVGPGGQPTTAGPPPALVEEPRGPELPAIPGYEILGFVGSGGQGDVYRARHVGLDRIVALKVLRDSHSTGQEQLARFRREGRVIARLDHPNIVGIYGFDESGGRFFLSMEYLAGGSLKDRLSRHGPFSPQAAVELLLTLAPAVEHAHQKGVVHRDLKPGNVLFTPDGQPKIVDFGVAKVLGEASSQQTRTGAVLGSPSYMAPEQAAGKISQVGAATDVYALGAILYELLAGRPPFTGESWLDTLDRVRFQPVEPPSRWRPDVPPDLEQICLKCLEKAVDRRYPSASQLGLALQGFAAAGERTRSGPAPRADSPLGDVAPSGARQTAGETPPADDRPGRHEDSPAKGMQVGVEVHRGFRLIRRIHAGAFGEIWSAEGPGGIKVALKIHYQPADQDEHHKKALELVKNLNHPYLLKTHAYWVHDGRLHVVMELADGSLRGRLKKSRRQRQTDIPLAALLGYLTEAAEALDFLHGQGLIHRNITPDNILLLKGHVKVGDFSQVRDGTAPNEAGGGVIGYMAPECYHGSATRQSDQYSLAITYVELRRRRRPFRARTTLADAMLDSIEGSPDLGDLSKAEKTVLLKALARGPAQRYPTCREFAAALSTAVAR